VLDHHPADFVLRLRQQPEQQRLLRQQLLLLSTKQGTPPGVPSEYHKAANRQNTRSGKDFEKSLLLGEKVAEIFDF